LSGQTVAVVIPVRNRAKDLSVLLSSLACQTVTHECIVVDQGSTDQTRQVAIEFGAVVVDGESETVGGLRNEGIAASDATVIALVDSDHQVPSDWLAAGLCALAENPRAGIVGAPYLAPDSARWVAKAWEAHRRRNCKDQAETVAWLSGGNLFFRREDFWAVGGFDTSLSATEDVDLCHRFRAHGYDVVMDPRIRNTHHGEPDKLSEFFRKQVWRGANGWSAWRKHGCPVSELKSLLFPIWVVLGSILCISATIALGMGWGLGSVRVSPYGLSLTLFLMWLSPVLSMAAQVVIATKKLGVFIPLVVLYLVFGFARFLSLGYLFRQLRHAPTKSSNRFDAHG